MADFNAALRKVLKWEGTYDNDPDDAGGETCFGITRVNEPDWSGWGLVEDLQKRKVPTSAWPDYEPLRLSVGSYYRKVWDKYSLDSLPDDLAQCIFGGIINQGAPRIIRHLQSCLSAFVQGVEVDGQFGVETRATLLAVVGNKPDLLMQGLKAKRISSYFDSALKGNNRKYLGGWLNRLNDGA